MPTIDPRQSLLALPVRLASLRQQLARARRTSSPGASPMDAAAPALAQRIASIAQDDPDRRRKAVRIVLEAELAREFGAQLLNDPRFPEMLDAVQRQMQHDAQAARAVHNLGEWLLCAAPAAG